MKSITRNWPLPAALIALYSAVAILIYLSLMKSDGHLTYIVDDCYIHMAIAKNLANHGVWGISPNGFTSSSSSLLWTLLLAIVYVLFGVSEIAPLVLNLIAASLLLVIINIIQKKLKTGRAFQFIVLLTVVFAAPLPSLVLCGLEHIIHALIAVGFIYLAGRVLTKDTEIDRILYGSNTRRRLELYLLILAPLVIMIRYEGLFLVFAACVLFMFRKRIGYSILMGGLSVLPLIIYGAISMAKGWYFLPNSILVKGRLPDLTTLDGWFLFLVRDIRNLFDVSALLLLFIAAASVFIWHYSTDRRFWQQSNIIIALFLLTAWLHLQLADIGLFFRYEAYLVVIGIFAMAIAASGFGRIWEKIKDLLDSAPGFITIALLAILFFYPLYLRGAYSSYFVPRSSGNNYNQQYQMGQFLKRYYEGQPVVVNDIGAVSFFGDIKTVDIWGLANFEIARAIRDKSYSSELIDVVAKAEKAKIAVIHPDIGRAYGMGGIPETWRKVGWWKIPNNFICFNEQVWFFAIDPVGEDDLRRNFEQYSAELPAGVEWGGE